MFLLAALALFFAALVGWPFILMRLSKRPADELRPNSKSDDPVQPASPPVEAGSWREGLERARRPASLAVVGSAVGLAVLAFASLFVWGSSAPGRVVGAVVLSMLSIGGLFVLSAVLLASLAVWIIGAALGRKKRAPRGP